ncbi:VOC family protein [Streptomyces rimosus]
MDFYGALFGWTYETGTVGETAEAATHGRYAVGLVDGRRAAGLMERPGAAGGAWTMFMATDDCDGTAKRIADAGGRVLWGPVEIRDYGRAAIAEDPVGALFGLWQGRGRLGCEDVNEPNALVRNDLIAPDPAPARDFYAAVFGYTLDSNPDMPDVDFTFLRRPDGHEIGGIRGLWRCRQRRPRLPGPSAASPPGHWRAFHLSRGSAPRAKSHISGCRRDALRQVTLLYSAPASADGRARGCTGSTVAASQGVAAMPGYPLAVVQWIERAPPKR